MTADRPRRILLIAYDFPPNPSPQSLRWAYLVRELDRLGHEIHVLAPEHPGEHAGLPPIPPSVRVHRTFPGPAMGLLVARARRRSASCEPTPALSHPSAVADTDAPQESLNWKGRIWHAGLNWKGRIFAMFQQVAGYLLFPDLRGEWKPWARRRLRQLLREIRPDVVISSHEPATTLELGLVARRAGTPLIIDLGDPVLAPYTPRRWRGRSRRLENAACRLADHVTVTTARARQLLTERHKLPDGKCSLLTQGFDDRREPASDRSPEGEGGARLELLYTGSFYGFRRHDALLQAVLATPGVRLSIASVRVPDDLVAAARSAPGSVRLLGFVHHVEALRLQREAHVLLNISNDDACQVPGKLYEYLGAGRPILHLGCHADDAAAQLLAVTGRGITCANETAAIAAVLAQWRDRLSSPEGLPPLGHDARIEPYSWSRIAGRLDAIIRRYAVAPESRAVPAFTDSKKETQA
jgi:glycosyltransferase involved in cell wall biosynthesis